MTVPEPGQPIGAPDRWLARLDELDPVAEEALLAGLEPQDPDLAPVAEVVRRLRARAEAEPVPPMSALLRDQLDRTVVVPFDRAPARRPLVAAAVAAAVLAVGLAGVGAAQNRLPAGLQDVVSSSAEVVGLDLPRADERDANRHGSDEGGDGGSSTSPAAGDATPRPGDRHEDADGSPDGERGGRADAGADPGRATPADPNEPAEPATPATPPRSVSDGGGAQGGGPTSGSPGGQNSGAANGKGPAAGQNRGGTNSGGGAVGGANNGGTNSGGTNSGGTNSGGQGSNGGATGDDADPSAPASAPGPAAEEEPLP